jgi:signal transduction histidine kinase
MPATRNAFFFQSGLRLAALLAFLGFSFIAAAQKTVSLDKKQVSSVEAVSQLVYDAKYIEARQMAIRELKLHGENPVFAAFMYGILADIETSTDNRKKALYYLRKAEKELQSQPGLRSRICVIAWKYANLYYEDRQYDSAYYYACYAIDSSKVHLPEAHQELRAMNLPIVGYHHYLQKEYTEAGRIYSEVLEINRRRGSEKENVNTYLKIADLEAARSDYAGAVVAADRAYALADEHKIEQYKLAAVNKLIDIHRQSGNYKEVARYLQLKMDLMDGINLAGQKKTLKELEAKYRTELKEQENRSLKAINKKQQSQNNSLMVIIVLSAVAAVAVLIFAIVFFAQKNRIRRQKANVDRLNALNQKIFSVISHDFKGPMMGLDLLLGMQEKYRLSPDRFASQSNQLRSDLKQANLILENLLSWSKTELGINDPQERNCKPALVLKAVIGQLDPLMRQKQLSVVSDLPESLEVPITSDSFTIILRNLLGNAIKYSYEEGVISIACEDQTGEFSISDRGTGMEEDRVQQLFARQLDSRLGTLHETGYGIGLSLVHELILKNDGAIRVESKPGEGTTVYFRFSAKKT